MKTFITILIVALGIPLSAEPFVPTDDDAVILLEQTATDIETNAKDTFIKIFRGNVEYWPRKDTDFFVFILNEDGRVISHPKRLYFGKLVNELKDVDGKKYREETVKAALKNKSGWVTFSLKAPDGKLNKKTYYRLVKGDDDKNYIICCDIKIQD